MRLFFFVGLGGVVPSVASAAPGDFAKWLKEIELSNALQAQQGLAGFPGIGLTVARIGGGEIYADGYGNFRDRLLVVPHSNDYAIPIASSSKLVTAATVMAMVDAGILSLDSTTGEVLDWDGPLDDTLSTITMRDLLSFTSGIPTYLDDVFAVMDPADQQALEAAGLYDCSEDTGTTLMACAEIIHQITAILPYLPETAHLVHPPGEVYDYGRNHMTIAGAMAERAYADATGQALDFNALYRLYVADPLGISADSVYYNRVVIREGTDNPIPAGGLRISVDDYNKILAALLDPTQAELADEMFRDQFGPTTTILTSPYADADPPLMYPYGLGAWIECAQGDSSCDGPDAPETPIASSGGMYGFYPWIDRDNGYYAILSTYDWLGFDAAPASFDAVRALRPLVLDLVALHEQYPE